MQLLCNVATSSVASRRDIRKSFLRNPILLVNVEVPLLHQASACIACASSTLSALRRQKLFPKHLNARPEPERRSRLAVDSKLFAVVGTFKLVEP